MKMSARVLILAVGALGLGTTSVADAESRHKALRARLKAHNEVPAVISAAQGEFHAKVDSSAETIEYVLSYEGLEGDVTQAHIHLGQIFASGGIMIWLCGNTPTTPEGVQACPAAPGEITGTIAAADVVGPAGQAVPAGSFADAIQAIRAGNAYVNVHSTSAPGGEVRGQIW